MGLIKCPDCKNKISSSAPTCPHCGRPMKGKNSKSGSSANHNVGCSTYVFLAIIVMVFLGWNQREKAIMTQIKLLKPNPHQLKKMM